VHVPAQEISDEMQLAPLLDEALLADEELPCAPPVPEDTEELPDAPPVPDDAEVVPWGHLQAS
jgi:hypothetical protein